MDDEGILIFNLHIIIQVSISVTYILLLFDAH